MQVTLFSYIWLTLILICFIQKDSKSMFVLLIFSMLFQCNILLILNGVKIGPGIITALATLLRFAFRKNIRSESKSKSTSSFSKPIMFCLFALALSNLVNGNEFGLNTLMLVIYYLLTLVLIKKRVGLNMQSLEKTIDALIIFVLAIGFLQLLTVINFLPMRQVLTSLIYSDVNNISMSFNKNHIAFYSTFMEPSFCAVFLIGAFFHILMRDIVSVKNIVLLCFVFIAILLTQSSTAYGGFAICMTIYVLTRAKKRLLFFMIPAFLIGSVLMFTVFYDYLVRIIFSKADTMSYIVRSNLNKGAFEAFLSNPYWGVGYGGYRASSLIFSVLSQIGIVGAIAYILVFFYFLKQLLLKKSNYYLKAYSFMVIGAFICLIIAVPDLVSSPFWAAIYIYTAAYNISLENQVNESNDLVEYYRLIERGSNI